MTQTPASPADGAPRRSAGTRQVARALWYVAPGTVELRPQTLPPLQAGFARVRTLFSGISRGTERLIASGTVPPAEYDRMRAPLQDGQFPFPVKYGYCTVGIVEAGPDDFIGRAVFCLHPHQDVFDAPVAMIVPLPDGLPARRATLAANMETALNGLWDSSAGPGDRIVVVGGGVLGLLVAALCAAMPGTDVTVVDIDPTRRPLAEAFGANFCPFADAKTLPLDADVVFHTSAHPSGLALALGVAGLEATVVELSWYGDALVGAPLGGAFHSRRLRLVSSQVGHVSAGRRPRWTHRRRLEKALALLRDARYDAMVDHSVPFADLPARLPALLAEAAALPPVIAYDPLTN